MFNKSIIIVIIKLIIITSLSFAGQNAGATVTLDLYTSYPTYGSNMGTTSLYNIGPDTDIYVKVYLKNVSNIELYQVDLLIDSLLLEWVKVVDKYDAQEFTRTKGGIGNQAEFNILRSGYIFVSTKVPGIEDGNYMRHIIAAIYYDRTSPRSDASAPDGDGLAGIVRLKTSANFTTSTTAGIIVKDILFLDNAEPPILEYGLPDYMEAGAINRAVVPVELMSFEAIGNDNNKITLKWTTASETNNYGFYIEKSSDNITWEEIGFVKGAGNSEVENAYTYIDNGSEGVGTYYYRFKQVDFDGTYEYSNIVSANISAPVNYSLSPAYPNPFNPSTTIIFGLKESGIVRLVVYNTVGQVVKTLLNEEMPAGSHSILFDAGNLASGIYFYRLEVSGFTDTKKVMLVK